MLDDDMTQTLRRCVAELTADGELARTVEQRPRATVRPDPARVTAGAQSVLASLEAAGASSGARLRMGRTLGQGGMGVVHLAEQTTMGRHVAVKTLQPGLGDPSSALQVLREAWITGALEHPNVVPVYDVGLGPDQSPLIVMKHIEGSPWSDLLPNPAYVRERFGAEDVIEWHLRVLGSVCNAVAFAHSRGIIHRDLKPANVMIGAFGEVYVVDWGLALSLHPDPSGRLPTRDEAHGMAGTPAYMAPEMVLGDPAALDERTDVYLLGAIFYEIFAGEPPHDAVGMEPLVAQILLSTPVFSSSFPSEAASIAQAAMDRDPHKRFSGVYAFRNALQGYLRHRDSRRLGWKARQSLSQLLEVLAEPSEGEERDIAVYNLLGECRFGYRAALEAWPDNPAAKQGLDRALCVVIEHELSRGDAPAASALLREVSSPPPELADRIDETLRGRAKADARLQRLERDLDPSTGTRTRTVLGGVFGLSWTVLPLVAYGAQREGHETSHAALVGVTLGLLSLGIAAWFWARDTLGSTLLNRRFARTLGLHFVAQLCLGAGAWMAGISVSQSGLLHVFSWMLTLLLLGIWVERWFFVPALVDGLAFLLAARFPGALFPLMSVANLVFTGMLVRVWFPQQDLARIQERRQALRREARRLLFLEPRGRGRDGRGKGERKSSGRRAQGW